MAPPRERLESGEEATKTEKPRKKRVKRRAGCLRVSLPAVLPAVGSQLVLSVFWVYRAADGWHRPISGLHGEFEM